MEDVTFGFVTYDLQEYGQQAALPRRTVSAIQFRKILNYPRKSN